MKILQKQGSDEISALILGEDSFIDIPPDKNPKERSIMLRIPDRRGVASIPLTFPVSVIDCGELIEQIVQRLIEEAGWKPEEARQFLPRGKPKSS